MNDNRLNVSSRIIRPIDEHTSVQRSVLEEGDHPEMRMAYRHCRMITRRFAKTFYLASRFLPNDKQRSIFAIYALCRHLDNLVDESEELATGGSHRCRHIEEALSDWKKKLQKTYEGDSPDHPVLLAFSDVIRGQLIPLELPLLLIDGVRSDLTKTRYETFDELYEYSYKVASVVGLMVSEVFGYEDKAALKYAEDLGIAMQLTNILRDVGEDLARDRIYLPAEDLRKYKVTEADLKDHRMTPGFVELMKYQIERTRTYYRSAGDGIKMLSPDSRLPVYLARYNYARILDRIEANNYQVFTKRACLSFMQKMAVLPQAWWRATYS